MKGRDKFEMNSTAGDEMDPIYEFQHRFFTLTEEDIDYEELYLDGVLVMLPERVSNLYIEKNKHFIEKICHKMCDLEINSEDAVELLTSILDGIVEFKPNNEFIDYESRK